jgi:hypothetical protein
MTKIPNSVIGAVSSVLAEYYYSHTKLNSLFMEAGAPGDIPLGNCEIKCAAWLRRCNDDPSVDPLRILGFIVQYYMDSPQLNDMQTVVEGRQRINDALNKNQLSYQLNGYISLAGASIAARTLADFLRAGDYASIDAEFSRALAQLDRDPHAAITAACAIVEAICKHCLETLGQELPAQQTVVPLWKAVQPHLGLSMDKALNDDQRQMLQGLASVVHGIGAFRTHIGSAHGRGLSPPPISVAEARLAVNAAHTLVTFIMELWQAKLRQAAPAPSPWQWGSN